MTVIEKYNTRVDAVNSLLCVGLDTNINRLPDDLLKSDAPQFHFNQRVIEQTHAYAAAYKLNIAFYEARGSTGWRELEMTMTYLRDEHPDIFTICDAKRADIGSTNEAYATAIFDHLGFDAITLHPYIGSEGLAPFLERKDKGCIILCRTSNAGANEVQDLQVTDTKQPLWQIVAQKVSTSWNKNGNCMLVVGATYPDEMQQVRKIAGDMTLLVPGIGVQGGNVELTMRAGLTPDKKGLIVNSSRGIIFSHDPAQAARELRNAMNLYR
jgi:orotidine-5'-phosphate decarboxylase